MHFTYIALDRVGKRSFGEIEAESTKAAADILRGQSLLPLKIEGGKSMREASKGIDIKNIFGRVALLEKINFIKNLGVMLKAGFPASRALKSLVEQTNNSTFKSALADIASQVEGGQTLAASMARYPSIFSDLFVNIVKVGEISGNLEESLKGLAVQLEKDNTLIRKTRGAMIYPTVVLSVMVLVVIVMFTFVLPKLTDLFNEFDVQLPFLTRVILGMVNFMKVYGIIVLLAFIAGMAGVMVMVKNPKIKVYLDALVLKMPVLGNIVKNTNLARFSRTLASLLHSGMPILESLNITGQSLTNNSYKKAVSKAENMVRSGSSISVALRGFPDLFPLLTVNMITVGEESGSTENILLDLALFYETEVDQSVSNLSSVLEPALMVIVGAGVGVLAVALIMPIYSITQSI